MNPHAERLEAARARVAECEAALSRETFALNAARERQRDLETGLSRARATLHHDPNHQHALEAVHRAKEEIARDVEMVPAHQARVEQARTDLEAAQRACDTAERAVNDAERAALRQRLCGHFAGIVECAVRLDALIEDVAAIVDEHEELADRAAELAASHHENIPRLTLGVVRTAVQLRIALALGAAELPTGDLAQDIIKAIGRLHEVAISKRTDLTVNELERLHIEVTARFGAESADWLRAAPEPRREDHGAFPQLHRRAIELLAEIEPTPTEESHDIEVSRSA